MIGLDQNCEFNTHPRMYQWISFSQLRSLTPKTCCISIHRHPHPGAAAMPKPQSLSYAHEQMFKTHRIHGSNVVRGSHQVHSCPGAEGTSSSGLLAASTWETPTVFTHVIDVEPNRLFCSSTCITGWSKNTVTNHGIHWAPALIWV